ncbi:MAG: hypothetical protein R3B13_35620 [Polyangiaceae bacterium]
MKMRATWMLSVLVSTLATGCVLGPESDDASRFREAIPRAEAVEVAGPDSATQASGTQSFDHMSSAQANEPWADGPWAYWYGFTRHVRTGVNKVTASVLGSVWIVVHTKPTRVDNDTATWGPFSDSLSPAEYRFVVTEVGDRHYEYKLEGRAKSEGASAAFVSVLQGEGWGKGHPSHGFGYFEINLDNARALDPFEIDAEDTGVVRIDHDLPNTITTDLFKGKRTVIATVTPSQSQQRWTAESVTEESGEGTLDVTAHVDVDDSKATLLEDVTVGSRWNTSGAGRADITVTAGDVPAEIGTVKATECWNSSFQSVYQGYSHNVTWAVSEGDASACVFGEPG